MKLFFALAIQAAVVFSCSISHRTNDYACTSTADCNSGRVCSDGYCVVNGTELVDAFTPPKDGQNNHPDAPNTNGCPDACTSCDVSTKQCTIDCNVDGSNCNDQVVCPAGWDCDVKCDTDNSCRAGVACAGTTGCKVECTGRGSCEDVQCGTSRCEVDCIGSQTCRSAIECNQSCGCDVKCTGNQSCPQGEVDCTSVACRSGNGCSSSSVVCHSQNCPALP